MVTSNRDPLDPTPPVGVTRGLIRHRDKQHVGSIWLNRDIDDEFEDPATARTCSGLSPVN